MRYSGAVRIRVWSLGVLSCLAGCGTPGREVSPAGIASTLETEPVVRVASWGHPAAAAPGQLEAGLLEAELQRDPDHPAVEDGLSSADETSRRRAAHALGHIGGPTALRRLAALVDSDAGVAGVGAIAFLNPPRTTPGEPPVPEGPWAELEDALWSRYAVTEDVMDEEVQALLLAIARVGGPRSIERLAADAARAPVGGGHARYAGAMHAMALLCAGGHPLTETARDAVVQGLEAAHPQARKSAIYALGRCARSSAEVLGLANERGVITERLVPLLDRGGDEARLVWRAFAALGELPAEIPSGVLGPQPPGWQVEVEAVRALRGSAAGRKVLVERLTDVDPSQMAGARHHAFIEALRGLRDFVSADADAKALLGPLGTAIESARGGSSAHDQHALAVSACELQLLRSIAAGSLMPLEACGKQASISESFADGLAIEALLHMGEAMDREARVNELLRRAADSRPSVAAPALAALADVEDARVNPALRSALDRLDVSLVSAAASAIAARSVDTSKRDPQAVEALIRTVRQLSNDEAVEARIVAIEALGSLGRTATPAIVESPSTDAPATPPSDWLVEVIMPLRADRNVAVRRAAREALLGHADFLRQFDGGVAAKGADFGSHLDAALTKMRDAGTIGLRFETTAGGFTLDFRGVPAPVNQANLVDLAGKGFYEGLRWHRVVPGFVVQGGDPHGDGYGGPGHVVPCEWSNVRYERGTVGIALAGKDTGGSQLFIAHSAQPHLDARYTIVGRVTDGMEVVDQLMPGDRIETVALLGADP